MQNNETEIRTRKKYLRNNNATILLQAIYKCNLKKANHEVVVIIFGVIAAAAPSFFTFTPATN